MENRWFRAGLTRRAAAASGGALLLAGAAGGAPRQAKGADAASGARRKVAPGRIALEEAFELPALLNETPGETARLLADLGERRLEAMDRGGVGLSVLSWTAGGAQAYRDPVVARELAARSNDHLAEAVSRHPSRYAGFAAVSMHDPEAAAGELTRCVRELGFVGAMINDAQETVEGPVFYDDERYDVFWRTAVDLGVPVYLHPRFPYGVREPLYDDLPWLQTAAWGFAAGLAYHTLRLVTTGLFDRVPGLQIVLGHMGEHIPYDLWRIDHSLERETGVPMERTVGEYFRSNVHVTTSGHFSTPALDLAIEQLGADRVMFSVDYPYVEMELAGDWFDGVPLGEAERSMIGRDNALGLLGLADA